MPEMTEAYDWRRRTLLDAHGEKLGKIEQVYLDLETEEPEWALVDTGLFSGRSVFVPVGSARPTGEHVLVKATKAQVKAAPSVEAGRDLSPADEAALMRHYGVQKPAAQPDSNGGAAQSNGDGAITRSEEELQVRTIRRPHTIVRLRKHVVTEMVTKTVPVRREALRVEREPVTESDACSAGSEPGAPDELYELVLHEEQLVIETRVVPVERVRMRKLTLTEQQTVSSDVRKERIEADTLPAAEGRST
jgi:uncharacterized protein (TIGR02271 family)